MYLEPLISLASGQVDHVTIDKHGLEAHYCDKHKLDDQRLMMKRLYVYSSNGKESKHIRINLFIGSRLITSKA